MFGGIFKKSPEAKAKQIVERLIVPHDKKSREVTPADIKRVLKEAQAMFNLCFLSVGIYNKAHAVAHPQIEAGDPLRFFVTQDANVIINPVLMNYKTPKIRPEGCYSFSNLQPKNMVRYDQIEVEYQTITSENNLSAKMRSRLSGVKAQVFQHELDHLNGKNIYS